MKKHSLFEKKSVMLVTVMLCCLLWGSAFPSLKLAYQEMGTLTEFQKIQLAGYRFALAGVGILVFAKMKLRTRLMPKRKEWPFTLVIALLQTFGAYLLYYIGLGHTTAVKGAVLTSLSAFIVAGMSHFMTGNDRMDWRKIIGLVCGFLGVVVVNFSGLSGEVFTFTLLGEGFIVIHCVLSAITIVLIRKYGNSIDVVRLNGWQFFLGGVMLIVMGLIGSPQGLSFNVVSLLLLVYLAVIAGVAFTLWFTLLKYHNASLLEQYKFASPLFGSALSVLLVPGEHFGPEMILAVALVAAGMVIVNRSHDDTKKKALRKEPHEANDSNEAHSNISR